MKKKEILFGYVSVRLSLTTINQLKDEADRQQMPVSVLVRSTLNDKFGKKNEK